MSGEIAMVSGIIGIVGEVWKWLHGRNGGCDSTDRDGDGVGVDKSGEQCCNSVVVFKC